VHDYYYGVLAFDTAFSAVTAPITVHKFFASKAFGEAAKLSTKAPFPDAVNTSVNLAVRSAQTLKDAKASVMMDVGKTLTSFTSIASISKGRERTAGKYTQLVDQTLANIEMLSQGIRTAQNELREERLTRGLSQ
jgi:hypothetical protein